jgi:hypothetical protein
LALQFYLCNLRGIHKETASIGGAEKMKGIIMKNIVFAALIALSFTTGFTCSKNTPAEQPAAEATTEAATEAAPAVDAAAPAVDAAAPAVDAAAPAAAPETK